MGSELKIEVLTSGRKGRTFSKRTLWKLEVTLLPDHVEMGFLDEGGRRGVFARASV